ncbi:unnamed protein product, partial [Rangifer tarandus platyrhynchus]
GRRGEEEERAEYTADIISTTVAEPFRTCFTAGGSKTSPVEQQPELQQPQDTVSLPLPPLPHATPDPFTLYRGSGCKSPRCSIQAADLSVIFGQQSLPPRLLRGSPTPISSLEQNERADIEASQVVLLQTMNKRGRGDLGLHKRS